MSELSIDSLIWSRRLAREPYLFHVTPGRFSEDILREGLIPGNERSYVTLEGFHRPRPGHVYLCDLLTTAIVEVPGDERALLRIDARELDPDRVNPDEDTVQQAALHGAPWVEVDPPTRPLDADGAEAPGQDGALAAWADSTPGFDAPEVARKSLEAGCVAYRGTVPASAIEVYHYPSRPAEQFLTTLREHNPALIAELPTAPDEGFSAIELARTFALARTVLTHAVAAGPPTLNLDLAALEPETAADIGLALRRGASAAAANEQLETSQVLFCASDLVALVPDLSPSWRTNKTVCRDLGLQAARVVAALAAAVDANVGAATAREAMEALHAARAEDVPERL